MKKPITWRLLVLVAGTLLGLLAGLGLTTPATAAAPSSVASASYDYGDAYLKLDTKHNRQLVVKGYNFDTHKKIDVKVFKVRDGKDKQVAHWKFRDYDGDFKIVGKQLQCGKYYRAVAKSKSDGKINSNIIYVKCKGKGRY